MDTIISSANKEIVISTEGPVALIGEKINPTGRKKLARALQERNYDYVEQMAIKQAAAGADILDVNVGVPDLDEVAVLQEVIKVVADATDCPLCIDSADPEVLKAALPVAPGKPLVNSVSGEQASLMSVLPLVKDRGAAVIGLTMDDEGIPNDPDKRMAIAEVILKQAVKIGIPEEDVIIDPLVMSVGADTNAGLVTLRAIKLIHEHLGLNINLGASNASFGLPERHVLNQAFLALAIAHGATCMITDVARLGLAIRAAELILGKDDFGRNYIGLYRKQQKVGE